MTTREQLIENVKEWISVDNEIREGQKKLKLLRKMKKERTEILVDVMKSNEIDCFDINEGKLVYKQNKSKAPLSKKHLLVSLAQYFKNDPRMVDELSKFIMESRQEKEKENIKRKIKK